MKKTKRKMFSFLLSCCMMFGSFSFCLPIVQVSAASNIPNGYYFIRNKGSGKYLDVQNSSLDWFTHVIHFEFNGGQNQLWEVEDGASGYKRIRSALHEHLYMDILNGWTDPGTQVQVFGNYGPDLASENFEIVSNGDGTFCIKTKNSSNAVVSAAANSQAWLATYDPDNDYQKWYFEETKTYTWSYSDYDSVGTFGAREGQFHVKEHNTENGELETVASFQLDDENLEQLALYAAGEHEGAPGKQCYFTCDVTHIPHSEIGVDQLSATILVSNLPNPKFDFESDGDLIDDGFYEESEVVALGTLEADTRYYMITVWDDFRDGTLIAQEHQYGSIECCFGVSAKFPFIDEYSTIHYGTAVATHYLGGENGRP